MKNHDRSRFAPLHFREVNPGLQRIQARTLNSVSVQLSRFWSGAVVDPENAHYLSS